MPDHRDKYYYLAKRERYRSRAAFKLLELQTKFCLLNEGDNVLEIGGSPGGWTQIITSITKAKVISVDISKMEPMEDVIFIRGRIEDKALKQRIMDEMERNGIESIRGVLSDAMSKTSGNQDIDHSSSYLICQQVMSLATSMISSGGYVVVKQFQGDLTAPFVNTWRKQFSFSKITKAAASRQSSREVYIIFQGFRPS